MGARLSKNDWTQFGLQELEKQGFHRLKAQTLAKKLGVSRGSFYWHFEDISEFEKSVLGLWKTKATENIAAAVAGVAESEKRLSLLIELALTPSDLERAIRSWSVVDETVADAVSEIDNHRFAYIEQVLKDVGVDNNEIQSRAMLLYWAGIGQTVIGDQKLNSMSRSNVERLAKLLSS